MQQPPTRTQDGSSAGSEIRSDAEHLRDKAANRLHSEVDSRKGEAVSQAQSVSSAIEQTAGNLDDRSPDWLKSAFRQGAEKLQQFADTIERKDSRQLMGEAQDFARNNPGTFLAACAGAGFAAARVLKAGGERRQGEQQQWRQQADGSPSSRPPGVVA